MISAAEALRLILDSCIDTGTEEVGLLQSTGRVLAQDVVADRDLPPYDRVMMDGIAIHSAAFHAGVRTFVIEKVQPAGAAPLTLQDPSSHCIEVMTGAVLPGGTDVIIPYEQCQVVAGVANISASTGTISPYVHKQGTDGKRGDLLIKKGTRINPAMIGMMASVGLAVVTVVRLPVVSICSTGDELVDIEVQPEAHQVRRSNVYMLAAALQLEGILATTIHLRDEIAVMTKEIAALLTTNDVILFSGAVSKGRYDFLPTVLSQLGMDTIFHTVAQRPGKPFLFGKMANGPLIFGFPGNPVSTFACYHQFFKRWLHRSIKIADEVKASLSEDVHFKPPLAHHLLVKLKNIDGNLLASPLVGSSSGDLVTLIEAGGIITLPPERDFFPRGEVFEVNRLHAPD